MLAEIEPRFADVRVTAGDVCETFVLALGKRDGAAPIESDGQAARHMEGI